MGDKTSPKLKEIIDMMAPKQNAGMAESPLKKIKPTTEEDHHKLNNLKECITFIGSLGGKNLSREQDAELAESLEYVKETVNYHSYYCQKTVNLGVTAKCLALSEPVKTKFSSMILQVFCSISLNKEKNLVVFND